MIIYSSTKVKDIGLLSIFNVRLLTVENSFVVYSKRK